MSQRLASLLALLLLLPACSSPNSGQLLPGVDDDDTVGDDDDTVGDDDDTVGDDDDTTQAGFPWAGSWDGGGLLLTREGKGGPGGGGPLCEGEASFEVADDGELIGEGFCLFGFNDSPANFVFTGFLTEEGNLRKGVVAMEIEGFFSDEYEGSGGVVQTDEGTQLNVTWQAQFGGGGGGFQANGEAWGEQ